jgi:Glyoxalase-like domain
MSKTLALPLDHTVINIHFDMDRAQAVFESLGFHLTPRGRHSLGSINHLIVLKDDYVEIVGLPTGTDVLRQEVLDSPVGIDGLVFQTQSADNTYASLSKAKLAVQAVQAFSRPVELDGMTYSASFRTTRFTHGTYPAGRVYFCQHLTPELVWRKEWQSHSNQVIRTSAFLIVANKPAQEAKKYLAASQGELIKGAFGEYRIRGQHYELVFVTPTQYAECYGALSCQQHPLQGERRESFFGAIALQTQDLDSVKSRIMLTQQRFPEIRWREQPGRLTVSIPFFNTLLDFVQ